MTVQHGSPAYLAAGDRFYSAYPSCLGSSASQTTGIASGDADLGMRSVRRLRVVFSGSHAERKGDIYLRGAFGSMDSPSKGVSPRFATM